MRAALCERSILRPFLNGPRSVIVTSTERPLSRFVTIAWLPNGNAMEAAVRSSWSQNPPAAFLWPWNPGPYHEAIPTTWGVGVGCGTGIAGARGGVGTWAGRKSEQAAKSALIEIVKAIRRMAP